MCDKQFELPRDFFDLNPCSAANSLVNERPDPDWDIEASGPAPPPAMAAPVHYTPPPVVAAPVHYTPPPVVAAPVHYTPPPAAYPPPPPAAYPPPPPAAYPTPPPAANPSPEVD